MRPALASALLVLSLTASAPAWAKPSREAAAHAKNGQRLFREGNHLAALAEFLEAQRLSQGWEYQYDIGVCEAKLGHFAEALDSFDKYLREGGATMGRKMFDATIKARDEIRQSTGEVSVRIEGGGADLFVDGEKAGRAPLGRPLVLKPGSHTFKAVRDAATAEKTEEVAAGAQLVVVLSPKDKAKEPGVLLVSSEPDGAAVFVDGKAAGKAPASQEVVPGLHIVVAELAGHAPAEAEVRVGPGEKLPVALALEPVVVEVKRPFPVAGVVVAGAGVLCVLGSLALYANAQYNKGLLDQLYRTGGTWDERYAGIDSTRRSSGAFSGIFGVLGGAALIGGATLIVLNAVLKPPPPPAEPASEEERPAEGGESAPGEQERPPKSPEKKDQAEEIETSLLLAPLPGGALATWTVRF